MDQFVVPVYIRLQLQNKLREAQHKLAQREAMSDMNGAVIHTWSKVTDFPAKFHFCNPGGRNRNTIKQFWTFSRVWRRHFWKVPLIFWKIVSFSLYVNLEYTVSMCAWWLSCNHHRPHSLISEYSVVRDLRPANTPPNWKLPTVPEMVLLTRREE